MRRNTILLATLAAPFTNALSLANFQDITSVLIPVTCLLTYDQQIPQCKVADFKKPGCSQTCKSQLTQLQTAVTTACSNVIVNSNTLLGIIKSGNILGALCPDFGDAPPTATTSKHTSNAATSPTKSSGGQSTTSTRQAQSVTYTPTNSPPSSTQDPVTEPTDTPTAEPTPSPAPSATDGGGLGIGGAATSSSPTVSAAEAQNTQTSGGNNKAAGSSGGSGGGSPFDISSEGNRARSSLLAFVVAVGAGIVIAR